MMISKELPDELLRGVDWPEDFLGDKGLMPELKVRLVERMLGELTEHPALLSHMLRMCCPAAGRALQGNDPKGWAMSRMVNLWVSRPPGAMGWRAGC